MSATISQGVVSDGESVGRAEPTAVIELNLEQLRLLAKSVSKTKDAETKKLGRMSSGSKIHADVKADWQTIDGVAVEIESAISQLIEAS